jgi:prepilin-type N-terminal cleavage/methylation domain-containing protein
MYNKKKGFTLIELMIAMLIIMVSMLALLTAITTSMRTNMQNEVRNAGIRVANQTVEALLTLRDDDTELTIGSHARTPGNTTQAGKGIPDTSQKIRDYTMNYSIGWMVSQLTTSLTSTQNTEVPNLKQLNVTVGYIFSNVTTTHTVVAYKSSKL